MSDERRFPRWVYGVGTEPDARFSLANERTFLAWIRTSLALLAGGVALEALDLPVEAAPAVRRGDRAGRRRASSPRCSPGSAGRSAERAVRLGTPLPSPSAFGLLVVGVCVAGVLVLVGLAIA